IAVLADSSFIYLIIPIQLACLLCLKYTKKLNFIFPAIMTIVLLFDFLSPLKPGVHLDDLKELIGGGYKAYPVWKSDFLNLFNFDSRDDLMSVIIFFALVFLGTIIAGALSHKLFMKIRRIWLANLTITLMTGAIFSGALLFRANDVDSIDQTTAILTVMLLSLLIYGFSHLLSVYPVLASDTGHADYQLEDGRIIRNSWDSIAGYEKTKQEIQEAVKPYTHKHERRRMQAAGIKPVKGILLFGPPGTGKTMFARVVASATKMNLITVSGSEFVSKYLGESEKNLREIFAKARASTPCLLFFDELESFLRPRNESRQSWDITTVTTFLGEMDGFKELRDVLIIGATNLPNDIDAAAMRPGRFDKMIYIGPPNLESRIAIWNLYLDRKADMRTIDSVHLAEISDRFTGADIKGVVEALFRANHYNLISQEQLVEAVAITKPTVSLDMREQYESFAMRYTRSLIAQEDVNKYKERTYSWDDIAGMDDIKNTIKAKVEKPLLYSDVYIEMGVAPAKGLLMYGPPGCGKTLFAKVIADECKASFFSISGPSLLRSGIGESEASLRRLFREARENKPAIIFFDEIDSIAENRVTNSSSVRILNQLLAEMDGMESLTGVFIIAATNRLDAIDSALKRPGRFDSLLYIGLPDELSRKKQFQYHLRKLKAELNFDVLARKSEQFTCADIAGCCMQITQLFIDRRIAEMNQPTGAEPGVSMESIVQVVEAFHPTLTSSEIQAYEQAKIAVRV
ncbi:AAA family ATPase, partial [bacterium]|nr:AAA family ATPase [candidate division CSSED10-310 bacterium]